MLTVSLIVLSAWGLANVILDQYTTRKGLSNLRVGEGTPLTFWLMKKLGKSWGLAAVAVFQAVVYAGMLWSIQASSGITLLFVLPAWVYHSWVVIRNFKIIRERAADMAETWAIYLRLKKELRERMKDAIAYEAEKEAARERWGRAVAKTDHSFDRFVPEKQATKARTGKKAKRVQPVGHKKGTKFKTVSSESGPEYRIHELPGRLRQTRRGVTIYTEGKKGEIA